MAEYKTKDRRDCGHPDCSDKSPYHTEQRPCGLDQTDSFPDQRLCENCRRCIDPDEKVDVLQMKRLFLCHICRTGPSRSRKGIDAHFNGKHSDIQIESRRGLMVGYFRDLELTAPRTHPNLRFNSAGFEDQGNPGQPGIDLFDLPSRSFVVRPTTRSAGRAFLQTGDLQASLPAVGSAPTGVESQSEMLQHRTQSHSEPEPWLFMPPPTWKPRRSREQLSDLHSDTAADNESVTQSDVSVVQSGSLVTQPTLTRVPSNLSTASQSSSFTGPSVPGQHLTVDMSNTNALDRFRVITKPGSTWRPRSPPRQQNQTSTSTSTSEDRPSIRSQEKQPERTQSFDTLGLRQEDSEESEPEESNVNPTLREEEDKPSHGGAPAEESLERTRTYSQRRSVILDVDGPERSQSAQRKRRS